MNAIGVLLAAGGATRLPNKPLLPLKNGKPALTSSLELFIRSGLRRVIVVVPPRSAVPDVIEAQGFNTTQFMFVEQHETNGVPAAIRLAVEALGFDTTLVVSCCDNVYGEKTVIDAPKQPYQCVQYQPAWKAVHLAKYDENLRHWSRHGFSTLCAAGWMCLRSQDAKRAMPNQETTSFLNDIRAESLVINDPHWWDIGTPDTYNGYWRS